MCDKSLRKPVLTQTVSFTYKSAISHSASSVYKWQRAGNKVHFFASFFSRGRSEPTALCRPLPLTSR